MRNAEEAAQQSERHSANSKEIHGRKHAASDTQKSGGRALYAQNRRFSTASHRVWKPASVPTSREQSIAQDSLARRGFVASAED